MGRGAQGESEARLGNGVAVQLSQCHKLWEQQAMDYNSRTLFHGGEELGDVLRGGLGHELLASEPPPLHQQRLCHGLGRVT